MKRIAFTVAAVTLAFPAGAAARGPQLVQDYHQHGAGARVLVAAHRAYWRGAPENSLPGIEQAIAHGADMIEIDVQRTSDGQLVLLHDTTVERTTNGTGSIASKTLAQMKALRLKEGLGDAQAAVTDVQVATLAPLRSSRRTSSSGSGRRSAPASRCEPAPICRR